MQIHEQNSSLAKESKVIEIGLDRVYSFSAGNSDKDTEGLSFRFMPDAEEVQQALQVNIVCTLTQLLMSCLKSVTADHTCTQQPAQQQQQQQQLY